MSIRLHDLLIQSRMILMKNRQSDNGIGENVEKQIYLFPQTVIRFQFLIIKCHYSI